MIYCDKTEGDQNKPLFYLEPVLVARTSDFELEHCLAEADKLHQQDKVLKHGWFNNGFEENESN